jgi:predicted acylesterase/phospholipase RssA
MPEQELKQCDLVMKGGITSGIVYPPAVLKLKDKYTFRGIGGTSAGAIAAAGIAAAEFHRDHGGFDLLEKYMNWLREEDHLRQLFQASSETKPLLDLLIAVLKETPQEKSDATPQASPDGHNSSEKPRKKASIIQSVLKVLRYWATSSPALSLSGIIGALVGIVLAELLPLAIFAMVNLIVPVNAAQRGVLALVVLLFGVLGAWLGLHVAAIVAALATLPKHFYGMCLGHSPTQTASPNLTDWLSDMLDEMAGLPPKQVPLTFGQLKGRHIDLKMVTSNLSHGQPYVLPGGLDNFLFHEDDMHRLFPEYVVKHLIDYRKVSSQKPLLPSELLPDKFHYLPCEDHLPVVVGARLSLSFPVLLSAVPLYTISTKDYEAYHHTPHDHHHSFQRLQPQDLQRNWFSDGGICSNFPIHFFDIWLPSKRPTFAMNLDSLSHATSVLQARASQRPGPVPTVEIPEKAVYLPKADDPRDVEWDPIRNDDRPSNSERGRAQQEHASNQPKQSWLEDMIAFGNAIFNTARNYHDTMQANLPSYRERTVQIRLAENEGGLNLTMPHPRIEDIMAKGEDAGQILRDKFEFEQHKWVRFRVLMAQLECDIIKMKEAIENPEFADLMRDQATAGYPYSQPQDWCQKAEERLAALRTLIADWDRPSPDGKKQPPLFSDQVLQQNVELRVTPEI